MPTVMKNQILMILRNNQELPHSKLIFIKH